MDTASIPAQRFLYVDHVLSRSALVAHLVPFPPRRPHSAAVQDAARVEPRSQPGRDRRDRGGSGWNTPQRAFAASLARTSVAWPGTPPSPRAGRGPRAPAPRAGRRPSRRSPRPAASRAPSLGPVGRLDRHPPDRPLAPAEGGGVADGRPVASASMPRRPEPRQRPRQRRRPMRHRAAKPSSRSQVSGARPARAAGAPRRSTSKGVASAAVIARPGGGVVEARPAPASPWSPPAAAP